MPEYDLKNAKRISRKARFKYVFRKAALNTSFGRHASDMLRASNQEESIVKYILGIDQGGTKTVAALMGTDGRIYGAGYEKGAYFPTDGMEYAMQLIDNAILKALNQAGCDKTHIKTAVAGITGVDWPGDEEAVTSALSRLLPAANVEVHNDCVIALYGGTFSGEGTVICAGTGINIAICKKNGERFVFGDYLGESLQGGCALAQRGARAVFDAAIGVGSAEKLTEAYLNFSGAKDVNELLHKYIMEDGFCDELRFIVPELMALAEAGDETTRTLLCEFADELCVYIDAGLKKMNMHDEPLDFVFAGSVFKGAGNPLRKYLEQKLKDLCPKSSVLNAKFEPVVGACIMGMLQNGAPTEAIIEQIQDSAEKMALQRK